MIFSAGLLPRTCSGYRRSGTDRVIGFHSFTLPLAITRLGCAPLVHVVLI